MSQFRLEDRSMPAKNPLDSIVDAANRLNLQEWQSVCASCGSLIGYVSYAREQRIDAKLVVAEIQTLRQFFNEGELNILLAWLGIGYNEADSLLTILIQRELMQQRMSEFTNRIKGPQTAEKPDPNDPQTGVRDGTQKAVNAITTGKNMREGVVRISPATGKKCIQLPNGNWFSLLNQQYLLNDVRLGEYVKVGWYKDKSGKLHLLLMVLDN